MSNTSETLSATINPENAPTTYSFVYGLTTTPATPTAPKILPAGVTGVGISATLTGLQQNTIYYYRIIARSLGGQVEVPATNLAPLSFTTP